MKDLIADIYFKMIAMQKVSFLLFFGSFGLLTKEPYTIMNCLLSLASCIIGVLHHHLCTPPLGTGLDIETSILVDICTMSPIYAHQIFSDFYLGVFKWQPF